MTNLNERHWFSVAQAAEYASVSTKTVRRALEVGLLGGAQHVDRGRWHIRRADVDAWFSGEAKS